MKESTGVFDFEYFEQHKITLEGRRASGTIEGRTIQVVDTDSEDDLADFEADAQDNLPERQHRDGAVFELKSEQFSKEEELLQMEGGKKAERLRAAERMEVHRRRQLTDDLEEEARDMTDQASVVKSILEATEVGEAAKAASKSRASSAKSRASSARRRRDAAAHEAAALTAAVAAAAEEQEHEQEHEGTQEGKREGKQDFKTTEIASLSTGLKSNTSDLNNLPPPSSDEVLVPDSPFVSFANPVSSANVFSVSTEDTRMHVEVETRLQLQQQRERDEAADRALSDQADLIAAQAEMVRKRAEQEAARAHDAARIVAESEQPRKSGASVAVASKEDNEEQMRQKEWKEMDDRESIILHRLKNKVADEAKKKDRPMQRRSSLLSTSTT